MSCAVPGGSMDSGSVAWPIFETLPAEKRPTSLPAYTGLLPLVDLAAIPLILRWRFALRRAAAMQYIARRAQLSEQRRRVLFALRAEPPLEKLTNEQQHRVSAHRAACELDGRGRLEDSSFVLAAIQCC